MQIQVKPKKIRLRVVPTPSHSCNGCAFSKTTAGSCTSGGRVALCEGRRIFQIVPEVASTP